MTTPGPGPRADVSGIILAGGRSSRFGSDKLVARIAGETLIDRAVAAVAAIACDVVIVVAPGEPRTIASIDRPVRFVQDPQRHGGPLVGLLAGLEVVERPMVLIVGGDMPDLLHDVLDLLVRRLVTVGPVIGAVALRHGAAIAPLPIALRTGPARDACRGLVGEGERRLRSVPERLPTHVVEEVEWRPLDPDGRTLRDVDRPADLEGR